MKKFYVLLVAVFAIGANVFSQIQVERLYSQKENIDMGDFIMNKMLPSYESAIASVLPPSSDANFDVYDSSFELFAEFFTKYDVENRVKKGGYYKSVDRLLISMGWSFNDPKTTMIFKKEGSKAMSELLYLVGDYSCNNKQVDMMVGLMNMLNVFQKHSLKDLMYNPNLLPNEKAWIMSQYVLLRSEDLRQYLKDIDVAIENILK